MTKEEIISEFKLREAFRKKVISDRREAKEARMRNFLAEISLRREARKLLLEKEFIPHESTGINVLAELLKKIVSDLEEGYKSLTSSPEQRESFREHILNAVSNALAPARLADGIEDSLGQGPLAEQLGEESDILISLDDEPSEAGMDPASDEKFIDVDGDMEPEENPVDAFGIEGLDTTGRNVAYDTFNDIETQIVDSYSVLDNAEDKQVFFDYLLTNLKLYFDRFEEELSADLSEPESPEYSQEGRPEIDPAQI